MKKVRGRPSKSRTVPLAAGQTALLDRTTEMALPATSEVPAKRKRGRPPKNATKVLDLAVGKEVHNFEVLSSAARKEEAPTTNVLSSEAIQGEALKDSILVPKVVLVKSPVTSSTVKVPPHGDAVIASASTSELEPAGHRDQQIDGVGTAGGTASSSSNSAELDESPSNIIGSKFTEHPRMHKKKYSIMDSRRKSKSENPREYGSTLTKKWQVNQTASTVEMDGMKYVLATAQKALKVKAAESAAESDTSRELITFEKCSDAKLAMKKRGWKRKAVLPSPPLSENRIKPTECIEEQNIGDEKQATGNTKKSPKSSQHPSQQLNQDQFCDIFGLIKTSELKKGGHTHKLHRKMGGKLRRTIKPRMAPEMVYRKYTIAKGCTIQGLMEEYEESDMPDSQEGSPGAASKSRTFYYEERVRRRPGMKGSPPHLMKNSSLEEKEAEFLARRKFDFGSPVSSVLPKKKEWLKPPSRKKPRLQELPIQCDVPESSIPLAGTKAAEKKVAKKGPTRWSQRPWMKEHICSTKAKMAIEMREREAEAPGIRRSARQKESQRKQWWHLLRANPDEYESGDEELLPAEDNDATGAKQSGCRPVSISPKDMMEVIHWLKKEDAKEKQEPKSKEYLAKVHHDRMVKAWQTRKANMATSTAGSCSANLKKKKKQQKKSVTEDESGQVSIISESTKASILEQLQPILSALVKDSSKMTEDKVIELSLPKIFSQPDHSSEEKKTRQTGA